MDWGEYAIAMFLQTITIIMTVYYKLGRLEERIKALERIVYRNGRW